MFEIKGKYATAKVFTDDIEEAALSQITNLLNQAFMSGTDPRFMPDVHAGKGCTIGTTMKIRDKVCPNLVGVDIACGMLVVKLPVSGIDMEAFDRAVHEKVPAGRKIHDTADVPFAQFDELRCADALKDRRAYIMQSIGTLGGGNHFVELDRGE